MNILVIFNAGISAGKKYVTDQVTDSFMEDLFQKGHNVSLFGQFLNGSSEKDFLEKNVNVYGARRRSNKLINYIILYFQSIKHILKSDFVYVHYPSSYKYIPLLCIFFGKKYGIHIRGQKKLYSRILKFIYKRATAIISISSEFANEINKLCGINKAEIVQRSLIPYTESDIAYTRHYEEKEEYRVLFLARIVHDKGIRELIDAIKVINESSKYKVKLIVVGDGKYMSEVKRLVDSLDLRKQIDLVGAIWDYKEKAEYYKSSDIYILPSYHEGFPQTLHEAMVFGTPIITTMVGGIPTLMVDKVNCIGISPKSVDSIVSALNYSLSNYSSMGELAKNAMKTVREVVDSSKPSHSEQLLSLIEGTELY